MSRKKKDSLRISKSGGPRKVRRRIKKNDAQRDSELRNVGMRLWGNSPTLEAAGVERASRDNHRMALLMDQLVDAIRDSRGSAMDRRMYLLRLLHDVEMHLRQIANELRKDLPGAVRTRRFAS